MYRAHPCVDYKIDAVAVELILGISGDGVRIGVQDVRTTLNDMDRYVLAAQLRVLWEKFRTRGNDDRVTYVFNDILLTQVIDLSSCFHACGTSTTDNETEQSLPLLFGSGGKSSNLEVVWWFPLIVLVGTYTNALTNDPLSDTLCIANSLQLEAVLQARDTMSR
jgi:hypothetical protein